MTTTDFSVTGMSCEHCVSAVSSELGSLPGVIAVDIDLATGAVAVTSDAELEHVDVVAAVVEAGYIVTGPGKVTGP